MLSVVIHYLQQRARRVLRFTNRHFNRAKGKVTRGEQRSHLSDRLCPGEQGPWKGTAGQHTSQRGCWCGHQGKCSVRGAIEADDLPVLVSD